MDAVENPLADLTDQEVLDAYDHAVGCVMEPRTSPEYREWWTARSEYFLRELERRDIAQT